MTTEPERRYRIEFAKPAVKQFQDLPRDAQERIAPHINALAETPRPRGVKKLKGQDDQYRIRVGDYRVIYTIQDERLIVLVIRIADRKDAYRP